MLKDELLALDIFIDNEYLTKYCNLIEENRLQNQIKYKTQKHHIICSSYYRFKKIKVNNSRDNLVNLYYKDHILAHYYLCLCTKDWFYCCAVKAFDYLIRRIPGINKTNSTWIDFNLTEQDLLELLPELVTLREEANKLEHNKNKDGKWINNGFSQKYIPGARLQDFLNENLDWKIGKLPMTDATKCKILQSKKEFFNTHERKCVVNDGVSNKFIFISDLENYLSNGWFQGHWDGGTFKNKKHSPETIEKNRVKHLGKVPWNKGTKGVMHRNRTSWT